MNIKQLLFICTSPEDKQKMLEMLKRLEEQPDSTSDDHVRCGLDVNSDPTESLEERLAGLDLGMRQPRFRAQNFGIS